MKTVSKTDQNDLASFSFVAQLDHCFLLPSAAAFGSLVLARSFWPHAFSVEKQRGDPRRFVRRAKLTERIRSAFGFLSPAKSKGKVVRKARMKFCRLKSFLHDD
jgi:hypothetical protein